MNIFIHQQKNHALRLIPPRSENSSWYRSGKKKLVSNLSNNILIKRTSQGLYLRHVVTSALVIGELELTEGHFLPHPVGARVGRVGVHVHPVSCAKQRMTQWSKKKKRRLYVISPSYLACCPRLCHTAPTCRPGSASGAGRPEPRPRTRCSGPTGPTS